MRLKFLLPVGEAKAEATLIRTLTPFSINAAKFCQEYNKRSLEVFEEGYIIGSFFWLEGDMEKLYRFEFGYPILTPLLIKKGKMGCGEVFDLYKMINVLRSKKTLDLDGLGVSEFLSVLSSYRRMRKLKKVLKKRV